ncbi:MAG TPA: DUF1611 domain-containing protein [Candidatus Krumholzibacteria bacterium]|nr:DUF1611 domain-containing protein [Candidatus Krumholzibacteria bacterium]
MAAPVVTAPFPVIGRRLLLLAERRFSPADGKTAVCIAMYHPGDVVAVLDSSRAGHTVREVLGFGGEAPVVADIAAGLRAGPEVAVVGVAPTGGVPDAADRAAVAQCLEAGVDVVSGLHAFLEDDAGLRALAQGSGARIWDVRRVSEVPLVSTGAGCRTGARVVLTVGSDCGAGKMTVALELDRAARRAGLHSNWAATGQTGMILRGRGVPVDRVIADFIGGATEALVNLEGAGHDVVFVEGQGALMHPGYGAVALGLLNGAMPDAMVLVHVPGRTHYKRFDAAIPPLPEIIAGYETIMRPHKRSRVAAVALNTAGLGEDDARRAIAETAETTSLPVTDVVRFGAGAILDALRPEVAGDET